MKGNEARVVFFLHPIDQLKDGQVSRVQPFRRSFAVTVLGLLGLLLGVGVLVFVLLQFGVQKRSQQEPFNTTTESPVTERTGEPESGETERSPKVTIDQKSTDMTSNQARASEASLETKLQAEIIQPGKHMIKFLVTHPLSSKITSLQIHDNLAVTTERSSSWLLYPLVASSSLLLAYLAFLIVKLSYSRSKLVQGWVRRLRGKPPKEEKMLLHTLPYYLAITRSSCEVS